MALHQILCTSASKILTLFISHGKSFRSLHHALNLNFAGFRDRNIYYTLISFKKIIKVSNSILLIYNVKVRNNFNKNARMFRLIKGNFEI